MKITLLQLKNLDQALHNFSKTVLPITVSYRVSKLLKQVVAELQQLEESRQKLVKTYGTHNEEKDQIEVVGKEQLEGFVKDYNSLMEVEVELNFKPLELKEIPDVTISPSDLLALSVLFKDDQE